jgi:hypothetical protein
MLIIFSINQTQSNSGWVVGGDLVVSTMAYWYADIIRRALLTWAMR